MVEIAIAITCFLLIGIFRFLMCEVSKNKRWRMGRNWTYLILLKYKVTLKSDVLVGKLSFEDVTLKGLKVCCVWDIFWRFYLAGFTAGSPNQYGL